jgi:exosortase E/protease (VPEID-CTERM system)
VNTPSSESLPVTQTRIGLLPRLFIVIGFLAIETLLISGLIQDPALDDLAGAARAVHQVQHWAFRFLIAYAATFAILLYLRGSEHLAAVKIAIEDAPTNMGWLVVQGVLLVPFALLSTMLYRQGSTPFWLLAIGWHTLGLAAALALFAALAPLRSWFEALRQTGALPAYSLIPAAGALFAFKTSQLLWGPAAALTFKLVGWMAHPFSPSLSVDAATLTLITPVFSVQVSEICSGLEGVGLMLVFCAAWLWYFRREYIFPRALIIFPIAVLIIFLLNAVRIAAILLIGAAGHQGVAAVGFHSQAGWIAFNLAAFGVAFAAKHSAWLNRSAHDSAPAARGATPGADGAAAPHDAGAVHDATAAYLMPLLAILAAGMVAHALSAGFDQLYPLRLLCAAIALFAFRRSYRNLDWDFSWRGVAGGVAVFAVWAVFARFLTSTAPIPNDLSVLSPPFRALWIGCRAAAAIVTVPIAEELAYRGFLMRRMVTADFATMPMRRVPWWAIGISAVVFGITHGSFWLPGIIAGLVYAGIAVKTGKIGESVVAHATTNSLVAIQVLLFGQWQLW